MVELQGVSKSFGASLAVDRVALSLPAGKFLTILGPSGCGKTTLLRMIAGFVRPSAGRVLVNGEPVEDVPPHKRTIGMVFQRLALFPHMTAAQNVAYPLKMRGFDKRTIPDRVAEFLRLVRLDGFEGRRPHELSGGQQQRVAIARALSFGPDLLLLDEPLSALDRKLREEMQLEFRRIQRELGVTTINVTHDQREALVVSDEIAVMSEGRVQQAASPEEVYRAPSNRFVASFIGLTALLRGTVEAAGEGAIAVRCGEASLRAKPAGLLAAGEAVECALRAEQVRVLGANDAAASFDNTIEAEVAERVFEGDRVVYELRAPSLSGATLYAFDFDPEHHAEHLRGAPVRLGWNARDLFAFPAEAR